VYRRFRTLRESYVAIELIPLSVVIPTRNRTVVLRRTLESLASQSAQPTQIVLVDASDRRDTPDKYFQQRIPSLNSEVFWQAAVVPGAASQRNQGVQECRNPVIGFFDDDILFEPYCIARLWRALQSDAGLGGVNAMITNQRYQSPGRVSRFVFRLMAERREASYAGKVLGPAVNLLPENRDDLPEIVPVQWLNTTCTMYRREALPEPPFPTNFTGYSLMEDLALSLTVGKRWKLANVRAARIYHDSQPGQYKDDVSAISRMELVNRHFVMTEVLERRRLQDYAKLTFWELCQLAICALQKRDGVRLWQELRGKLLGIFDILKRGHS
jgi:glycosyltransferase involved in cell wall biosynthesis